MDEEDILKELFDKTEINYFTEGIEEAVLKDLEIKNTYRKQQQHYELIGKSGLILISILSIFFILGTEEADMSYLLFGSPFILFFFLFPLDSLLQQKITNTV